MTLTDVPPAEGYARLLFGKLTLATFAVSGTGVALAEWTTLPRAVLVVAAPAIVATLLLDTFLFNEFLIRTGDGFWVLLYTFLYVQAVAAAAVVTWLSRIWSERRPGGSPE